MALLIDYTLQKRDLRSSSALRTTFSLPLIFSKNMNICEYCGRIHHVELPDSRFCSVACRVQHEHFMDDLESCFEEATVSYQDYVRTGADYLAQKLIALGQQAASLLEATEQLKGEPLSRVRYFFQDLARGNSAAEGVRRALSRAVGVVPPDDQQPLESWLPLSA
jgi:hypothetical protein